MPSSFRDPKSLADWIQLDYFRKPGRVWRVRTLATWLIFIICTGAIAVTWWPRLRFIYQSRPVSSAHAMFNDNCCVCHVETFQPATRLLRGDSRLRSVQDHTCRTCHAVGKHQECVAEPNCSLCHQEHRGNLVLARVTDTHCTRCHADLNAVCPSRTKPIAANISGFVGDHPPFGGGRLADPGTIRFNHKVHLNLAPESVRGIDEPLAALRQQSCSYCHQPDAAGRYMKPINYDQHCRQCHALSVGVAGSLGDAPVRAAAERFGREPAPHKDPVTVRGALRERYTRLVHENPAVLGSSDPAEPPRWLSGVPPAPGADKESLWVNQQLQQAERMIFDGANGCSYCHKVDVARGPVNLPQYAASRITAVWLPHSIFSHERHRMLRCGECHDNANGSSQTKDVLLPAIDTCRECHNPAVGARVDCAECHRYHDRGKEMFRGQKTIDELTSTPGVPWPSN